MPKKRPIYQKGAYYHIFNRGAGKQVIFFEPTNYQFLLKKVSDYAERFDISILVYCLMSNHYHFLVRQDGDAPISLLFQRVFNSYVKAVNKQYERSGSLFEGPYKVKQIKDDVHLHHVFRYIHANPVQAGIVESADLYPHSNFSEWIGISRGKMIDRPFVDWIAPDKEAYAKDVAFFGQTP